MPLRTSTPTFSDNVRGLQKIVRNELTRYGHSVFLLVVMLANELIVLALAAYTKVGGLVGALQFNSMTGLILALGAVEVSFCQEYEYDTWPATVCLPYARSVVLSGKLLAALCVTIGILSLGLLSGAGFDCLMGKAGVRCQAVTYAAAVVLHIAGFVPVVMLSALLAVTIKGGVRTAIVAALLYTVDVSVFQNADQNRLLAIMSRYTLSDGISSWTRLLAGQVAGVSLVHLLAKEAIFSLLCFGATLYLIAVREVG